MYNPKKREKFATQVSAELLAEVKAIASTEGRQIQALVEEALADLVAKHDKSKPNPAVMAAYEESVLRYDSLYKRLAQ